MFRLATVLRLAGVTLAWSSVVSLAACDTQQPAPERLHDRSPPGWPDGANAWVESSQRYSVRVAWTEAFDDHQSVRYRLRLGNRTIESAAARATLTLIGSASDLTITAVDAAGNESIEHLSLQVSADVGCDVQVGRIPVSIGGPR